MSDQDTAVHLPTEQTPVTLFGLPCLAVRSTDGSIYLAIRDLCLTLGIHLSPQLRRIRNHRQLSKGLARFRVQTEGGLQAQDFLHLQVIAAWLLMVNTSSRTREEVRIRLDYLQEHLIAEVYAAFARLAGLPEGASRQIEDLDDLARIESALSAIDTLAARQAQLEQSQDRARVAWRDMRTDLLDLATRVHALEQKATGTITRAQRGYIYQLVIRWADARVRHDLRLTIGAARAACWGILKSKYNVAKYEDLPLDTYAECIAFIKKACAESTGLVLDLPEQAELGLER
jgi:P22_AR N-terminal domain